MGTVYLATDRKHGRRVAIKVLTPDLASALGPDRFLREIEIAARLSHPHILPLHDSGHAAGMLYYVMPWIEGQSLRARLAAGPLPVDVAVKIGREIADALAYAHRSGVIHRDVKPENILLAGHVPAEEADAAWHAMLADFGVARALAGAGESSADRLTESGQPLGTAAYASPEQAAGSKEIDARSDVYSLGCVLFEMLVGDPPGSTRTADLLARRFAEPLPSVSSLRPDLPGWVGMAVARAVAARPADRFATAGEFRRALGEETTDGHRDPPDAVPPLPRPRRLAWMAAGAAALALLVSGIALFPQRRETLDPKRVLVAVFQNRTGDPTLDPVGEIATDYVARGLATTRLMQEVYDARAEDGRQGAQRPDARQSRELARGLGAGTVLWGGYYRRNDSLQFDAQIIDARTGRLVLSLEPATGAALEQTRVVEMLRQRVMAGFAAVFGRDFAEWEAQSLPPTYEAYQEALAGEEAGWGFDFDGAIRHFERAIALDSTYVGAKANLAMVLAEGGRCATADSVVRHLDPLRTGLPPIDRGRLEWARAKCQGDLNGQLEAGRTVIAAAPRSVGFAILTSVMALELFRPREAIAILERQHPSPGALIGSQAGMLSDFLAIGYHELGDYARELTVTEGGAVPLAALGRNAEVGRLVDSLLDESIESSGESPGLWAQCIALELRAHGHPAEAQRLLVRTAAWFRRRPPDEALATQRSPCLWHLFNAAYYAGEWEEARNSYARLAAEDTLATLPRAALGALALRRGDTEEAGQADAWLARHPRGASGPLLRARLAALAGRRDEAVRLLREAFGKGLQGRMYLHIDPDLDSLRGHPPYEALVRVQR